MNILKSCFNFDLTNQCYYDTRNNKHKIGHIKSVKEAHKSNTFLSAYCRREFLTDYITDRKPVAGKECLGGHFLFALRLNFTKLNRLFTAGNNQRFCADYSSRFSALFTEQRRMNLYLFTVNFGCGNRPRIKSSDFIMHLKGRFCKINRTK